MIQKGMALRYNENYPGEIEFAGALGFDFFQIWFFNGALSVNTLEEPKHVKIKEYGFPIILHAVFDLHDFEKHGDRLLELIDYFGHKEVIVHPVCTSEKITGRTVFVLREKLEALHKELKRRRVRLYVENNSAIDGFFNTAEELSVVFGACEGIGLLLDLAHVNDLAHLREIVRMRRPACLHIADKRFGVPHEHLPLGEGDLNFERIFRDVLPDYSGRIILEAVDSKRGVEKSKQILDRLFPTA